VYNVFGSCSSGLLASGPPQSISGFGEAAPSWRKCSQSAGRAKKMIFIIRNQSSHRWRRGVCDRQDGISVPLSLVKSWQAARTLCGTCEDGYTHYHETHGSHCVGLLLFRTAVRLEPPSTLWRVSRGTNAKILRYDSRPTRIVTDALNGRRNHGGDPLGWDPVIRSSGCHCTPSGAGLSPTVGHINRSSIRTAPSS